MIAEELLGCALDDGQFAPCPGAGKHSKGNGRRDFRVVLDGAPTAYCFHANCSGEVEEFNKEMRRRIWLEERGDAPRHVPPGWEGVAAAPKPEVKARPPIDEPKVEKFTRGLAEIGTEWYRRRSPVDVAGCDTEGFLSHLYKEGERVSIFTDWRSQGDFCFWVGKGGFRLS